MTAKKSGHVRHQPAKGIGDKEKGRERGEMRDQRCAEREGGCEPMSRVKMISSGDLNQFIASGKFVRQVDEKG